MRGKLGGSFILLLSVLRVGGGKQQQIMDCVEELNTALMGFGMARKIRVGELIKSWTVLNQLK